MDSKYKLIIDSFGSNRFKLNEPLSEHSALKVGGSATLFFMAFTTAEIVRMVDACRDLELPYLIYGTGSKMAIPDKGFAGLVIQNKTKNIEIVSIKGKVSKDGIGVDQALIKVDSGVTVSAMVAFLQKQGLLYQDFVNVPGSIGGNVLLQKAFQNKVETIEIINEHGEIEVIAYNLLHIRKHVILSVALRIKSGLF